MNDEILKKLLEYSEEEIDNLNGRNIIDNSIFNEKNEADYRRLLLNDEMITVRKHARFQEYPKHKHNYIEMMYVYNGSMSQMVNGKKVVIKEGEILFLNKGITHQIDMTKENDIIFNFIIHPNFFSYLSSLMSEKNDLFNFVLESLYSKSNRGEFLVFHSSANTSVNSFIENIITCIYESQVGSQIKIKLLISLMFIELLQQPEKIEIYEETDYDKVINASVLQYIKEDYKQGSLTVISNSLHQPDYQICRIVKKCTGFTFKQLVQEERMRKASELLFKTNLSIMEVMEHVGYENTTHFYKLFKKKFKKTPKQYRISLETINNIS